jgi:Stress responsive A/B Barrel Domain
MSIRHVVLFEHKNADEARIRRIIDALNALPAQIDWIREWSITEDLGHRPGSCRFCLIAVFDDMDAMSRYLDHPAHQAAVAIGSDFLDKLAEHDHTF